jgi:hypothetical protein
MRTEQEIKHMIKETEKRYDSVLKGSMATVVENAPRALMQLAATSVLDGLYFALGKDRPRYEHEERYAYPSRSRRIRAGVT